MWRKLKGEKEIETPGDPKGDLVCCRAAVMLTRPRGCGSKASELGCALTGNVGRKRLEPQN